MKNLVYMILLTGLLTACSKDKGLMDSGTIIGQDYRKCMCCGGWFIRIEKDTLRFDQLPRWCTINLDDAKYPIDVRLNWHHKDPKCLGDEIIVTGIELKK